MQSKRLTFYSVAAVVLASSATHAADYPQPIYQPEPQQIIIQQPAPAAFDCCDGWYLRGQVGVAMNNADYELSVVSSNVFDTQYTTSVNDFSNSAPVGYDGIGPRRYVGVVVRAQF